MSRRFTRISLLFALLLSSEVWAIGLGDIRQSSALNEPLRAEILLLGATPEEVGGLTVQLASAEDFARYGIDRPFFLQEFEFNVVNRGVDDSIVQVRSRSPVTEPFVTVLVEATWPGGRLLREYTMLLDPPTYTPPGVQQAPAVQAPVRQTPADSAPIERSPAATQPSTTPSTTPTRRPAPQPATPARSTPSVDDPKPQPHPDDVPFDTTAGGDVYVNRGDTLWGIASRMRPDSRLTMNQTMLAIYEANRGAFDGNINRLKAGASLRIPSADEVFQINRGDALSEVQRQNAAWDGSPSVPDSTYDAAVPADTTTTPSLVLVPPDEEQDSTVYDDTSTYEPYSREQEIEDRIAVLEAEDLADQASLIEIRDNELAALRQELAEIRGEVYEPPVEDIVDDAVDDLVDETASDDEIFADDEDAGEDTDVLFPDQDTLTADDETTADDEAVATPVSSDADEGIVGTIMGYLSSFWMAVVGGAVILVLGLLVWFMRRGGDDDDYAGDRPWETLDGEDATAATGTFTETMEAPTPEEAFVVVEQDSGVHPVIEEDTVESPAAAADAPADDGTAQFGSLEDTFSSETAVNLDQTDPIAEADFHMAYGLYDQAADLINGALATDPGDRNLMSKLCEIYFVWGNRDAFIEAATRLKSTMGGDGGAEWDKIVIMGQQIAADHDLFAGAAVAGATKAVDLAFDDGGDETGALDMDFGSGDGDASDVVDLGADDETQQGVDFMFDEPDDGAAADLDSTAESPTLESEMMESTAEMPTPTVESPTIEDQFDNLDGTSELPSLDDAGLGQAIADSGQDSEATAEINLDELDLNIGDDDATELASLDDLDATGTNEALDPVEVTGKNPEVDPNATGVREALDSSGIGDDLGLDDLVDTGTSATGLGLAADETGQTPGIDDSLLDATGMTQVLTEDMAVETGTVEALSDEAETLLAPLDDDDDDFDFAKTEALPPDAYTGNSDLEDTAETPALAGTDVDLDLSDLTEALKVSDAGGDTIEQVRDDATVEQPRPPRPDETAAVPTMSLAPDEMSDDLNEARTMTEVGTKLDLARAYVDMGDPAGARSILEEVLDEGDEAQKQQAQQLLDSLPS